MLAVPRLLLSRRKVLASCLVHAEPDWAKAMSAYAETSGGALVGISRRKRIRWKALKPPKVPFFQRCDRDDEGHCIAGSGGGSGGEENESREPEGGEEKAPATRGEMAEAKRVGKGKEAKVVLADGSDAPPHIKPSMVPPNWTGIRVAMSPDVDVQVTGRDAAGRPKTVYRDSFHMRNAAIKFSRVKEMLDKHEKISRQIQEFREDPTTREEADCVWLMDEQATRPGSDKDTKAKVKAFGATTLLSEHVVESEDGVRLKFIGKEGVAHDHLIRNPKLAEMLRERKRTAGERGGRLFGTSYEKVTAFATKLDGGKFTPKDFRTKRANLLALAAIREAETPTTIKAYKAAVKSIAEKVSHVLGNRPAQALESYISPEVFSGWREMAHA